MTTAPMATMRVLDALLSTGARKATKYLSDKLVVKASRLTYGGRLPRKTDNVEVRLTIGRPNYEERIFIKKCKLVGEPFPVQKVQLRFPKTNKK